MDNLFNLGSNRLRGWALILLPFFVFASDTDILSSIDNNVASIDATVDHISDRTDDIYDLVYDIDSDVGSIEYQMGDVSTAVNAQTAVLNSINTRALDIYTILHNVSLYASGGLPYAISVRDESVKDAIDDVGDDVRSIDSTLTDIAADLSGISFTMPSLLQSLNNLTNYFSAVQSGSFTNFSANLGYLGGVQFSGQNVDNVFYSLFGYYPSAEERQRFADYVKTYGSGLQFYESVVGAVPNLSIYTSGGSLSRPLSGFWDQYHDKIVSSFATSTQGRRTADEVQARGEMYYLAYGTRPLIDFFEQSTNDYPLSNRPVIVSNSSGESTSKGFASGFVDTVVDLGSSFLPTVNTNVSSIVTNSIEEVANNSYQTFGQGLLHYDNSDLAPLIAVMNDTSLYDDISQALMSGHGGGFDFNFNLEALPHSVGNVTFHVSDSTQATSPIVNFVCSALKVAITVAFIALAWNNIIKPSPLFYQ